MSRKRKIIIIAVSAALLVLILAGLVLAALASLSLLDLDLQPIGGDWRTWRGYSRDYSLTEEETVTFSGFREDRPEGICQGYAVYDAASGRRIAAIMLDAEQTKQLTGNESDFLCQDRNGDGRKEIGITLNNGTVIWYAVEPGTEETGFDRCPVIEISHLENRE